MLEGAAIFCAIGFLLEGRIPALIAASVIVILMAARFPTRGAVDAFVEDQETLMLQERQAG
jgi:hypothetical protein